MRVFWVLLLLVFAASMGALFVPDRASTGEEAQIIQEPLADRPAARPDSHKEPAEPVEPVEPVKAIDTRASQEENESRVEEYFDRLQEQANTQADAQSDTPEEAAKPGEDPAASTPDPFAAAAEAYLKSMRDQATDSVAAGELALVNTDAAAATESPKPIEATEAPRAASSQSAATTPAEEDAISIRADGSLRIGETVVLGDGTEARPYELNWPLLTGVGRVYKPEKGMKEVPEWLGLLEGKRVRLTGHIVLPLVAVTSDELLLTMNPWDGCCVGVPPTPYDAMEVTLAQESSMQGASMYGTLEGTLRTDPYIVGGWLLGLYLLDDARIVN